MKISSIVQYNADLKEDTLADSTRILFLKKLTLKSITSSMKCIRQEKKF